MIQMHLVFGGPVTDPQQLEFTSTKHIDIVGVFDDYIAARQAWESSARRTIDDAEMKYIILDLGKVLSIMAASDDPD